jgi:hypothetical protein
MILLDKKWRTSPVATYLPRRSRANVGGRSNQAKLNTHARRLAEPWLQQLIRH